MFTEIPADEVKPVFSKISSLISLAVFEAEIIPLLFSVTSRYASSSDKVSTKSVYEKKTSDIIFENSLYLSNLGLANIRFGHSF